MCQVAEFECVRAEDLMVTERALGCFLTTQNPAARNIMVGVLRTILEKYGTSKIHLQKCVVIRGQHGGVRFLPRQTTKEKYCPGCGEYIYTPEMEGGRVSILSVLEGEFGDIVSYGCSACGQLFGKWEDKEIKESKENNENKENEEDKEVIN